jgi:3D (Asp-Asp-Asp) domain-containing protein
VVRAAAAGILAAALFTPLGLARAAATPRAAALRAEQASLVRREHAAVLDLFAVESGLSRARGELQALRARSADLADRRAAARRHAAAVRQSLATARSRLDDALRALYREGQPDAMAILFGASSLDQAVDGIDGLRRTARTNRQLVADLRRRQASVRAAEARLARSARQLAAAEAQARLGVTRLEQAARTRQQKLSSLRARRDLTARQVASLDALALAAERRSAALAAAAPARPAHANPAPAPVAAHVSDVSPPAPGGTRALVVDVVAYHLPGHTASGLPVGVGVVAVDPSVIPLGTRLFVPGYGPAVAADVGSAIKGTIIDLWMPSRAKALAWGRRTVTITVYG